jgi:hypothetical protein
MGWHPLPALALKAMIGPMATTNPVVLQLEVQAEDESLSGRVRCADGTIHEFTGWLGLLRVLGSLVPGTRPPVDG